MSSIAESTHFKSRSISSNTRGRCPVGFRCVGSFGIFGVLHVGQCLRGSWGSKHGTELCCICLCLDAHKNLTFMLHNPKQPNHLHHHKQRFGSPIKSEDIWTQGLHQETRHTFAPSQRMHVRADNYTNLWRVRPAKKHHTVETISSHSLCQLAHALSHTHTGGAEGTQ